MAVATTTPPRRFSTLPFGAGMNHSPQARVILRPNSIASALTILSDAALSTSSDTAASRSSLETIHGSAAARTKSSASLSRRPQGSSGGSTRRRTVQPRFVAEEDEESDLASASGSVSGDETPNLGEDGGIAFEGYVMALHDFTSENPDCLSFRANQVIKVHNRDASGWWDGELDGERGWFPSNYVDDSGLSMSSTYDDAEVDPLDDPVAYHSKLESEQRRLASTRDHAEQEDLPIPTTGTVRPHADESKKPSGDEHKRKSLEILQPIRHSIGLLQSAVRVARWAHFQPATACVISSVRTVLSETDCLTRESATLRKYPGLARERKAVLSELSRLVTQSRRASASEGREPPSEEDMEAMLRYAFNVLSNTRTFLAAAAACGAALPVTAKRASYGSVPARVLAERPDSESDRTPTPGSLKSPDLAATRDTARNRSPLVKATVSKASETMPSDDSYHSDPEDEPFRSEPDDAETSGSASAGYESSLASPTDFRYRSDFYVSTSDESSAGGRIQTDEYSAAESDAGGDGPEDTLVQTRDEIFSRATRVHDHLVSVIAAFIGHLHAHTHNSPRTSSLFLVDLTQEVVSSVMNLLMIVEGVQGNTLLQEQISEKIAILGDSKDRLQESTSVLVVTSRPTNQTSVKSSGASIRSTAGAEGEVETRQLLGIATKMISAAQHCVSALRDCLLEVDVTFSLTLSTPSKAEARRDAKVEARKLEEQDGMKTADETALEQSPSKKVTAVAEPPTPVSEPRPAPRKRGPSSESLSQQEREAYAQACLEERYAVESPDLRSRSAFDFDDATGSGSEDEDKTLSADGLYNEAGQNGQRGKRPSLSQRRGQSAPHTLRTERSEHRLRSLAEEGDFSSAPDPLSSLPSSGATSESGDDTSRRLYKGNSRYSSSTNRSDSTANTSVHSLTKRGSLASLASEAAKSQADAATSFTKLRSMSLTTGGSDKEALKRIHSASDASFFAPDYKAEDICFNADGQVTGATLPALIERMTPHASMVAAEFSTPFFLCFRVFASPETMFDALMTRYNMTAPVSVLNDAEALKSWRNTKLLPIRLRVLNVFRMWLELHWQPVTDRCILASLISFLRGLTTPSLALTSQRLLELATRRLGCKDGKTTVLTAGANRGPGCLKRIVSGEKLRGKLKEFGYIDISSMYLPAAFAHGVTPMPPAPVVSKSLLLTLKTLPAGSHFNVLEMNPLELARQLTIMESKIFCCILPEELVGQSDLFKKAGHQSAVHVKQMSALTTQITGWIAECILDEADVKKRSQLVKYFIKLGDRCLILNNFNALFAIQSALNASTIGRLRKTWDGVPSKYMAMMEEQSSLIEHTRNFSAYRARLRAATAPALPFVGLFLTDITFCHQGNGATRPSPLDKTKQLINFDKYAKDAKIVQDLQRFQVPFNLVEVPEIQRALTQVLGGKAPGKGARPSGPEELYKRSLLLEPRKESSTTAPPASAGWWKVE